MKASEFRVGNNIYYNSRESEIDLMDFVSIEESKGEELRYYEPIPLTEDYAIKLGFEKREIKWHDNSVSEDAFVKFKYLLSFTKDGIALSRFMSPGNSKVEPIYIASPETVHHLQNLWHALTGEELSMSAGTK